MWCWLQRQQTPWMRPASYSKEAKTVECRSRFWPITHYTLILNYISYKFIPCLMTLFFPSKFSDLPIALLPAISNRGCGASLVGWSLSHLYLHHHGLLNVMNHAVSSDTFNNICLEPTSTTSKSQRTTAHFQCSNGSCLTLVFFPLSSFQLQNKISQASLSFFWKHHLHFEP